jgi:glucosamine-6-phosphate deaminase
MDRECARYDAEIVLAGGIDLQLLGIGHNGHIGFNEPSDRFVYGTHVVELTQSTLKANLRFFEREDLVPRRAVSMGIGTIMSSKSIILLALGKEKAQAVYDMVRGEMTPRVQASILRVHPDVTVLLDSGAASLL